MKLLIGGDFAPTKQNFDLFEQGDAEALYSSELLNYLKTFDYRVFDFETVFEGKGTLIEKHGPLITTPTSCLPGITAINPNLFVLANNHINNLGKEGIQHSFDILEQNNIAHVGAGVNLTQAREPYILEHEGLKIGFYACAEHEFNAADKQKAGVNPYDPLESFDDIRKAKALCDYLIVFYHGGMIEYRYPLPTERRVFRKFVDAGADLIVGQHTHCIGCAENYQGKTLLYGQGDFLFARPTLNEYRYSGLLLEITIDQEGLRIDYNLRIKPKNTIRLATDAEKEEILGAFLKRGQEIQDPQRYAEIYESHLEARKGFYLDRLLGKFGRSLLYAGLNKLTGGHYRTWKMHRRFSKTDWLILDNWVSCETHQELFRDMIQSEWQEKS